MATFAAVLSFAALGAFLACMVLPCRMLPDYRRGGWGRYSV